MEKETKNKKTLLLLDSNGLIHRAYHALPPMSNPKGEMVNAVYGFISILLRVLKEIKPDFVAATFDLAGPTFRHEAFAEYKIHRPKMDDDLVKQLPLIREVVGALNIPAYEKQGFEADDVIGTISSLVSKKHKDVEVIILSGDMDTLQLVEKNVRVYTFKKGVSDAMIYGEKEVLERYGLTPSQVADFKGLKGDPSDNIPGVPGIGDKSASALLQHFGNIEKIYKYLTGKKKDAKAEKIIKPKMRQSLEENKDQAFFSRELATINSKVPVKFKLEDSKFSEKDLQNDKLYKFIQSMGFFSLISRLNSQEKLFESPQISPVSSVKQENIFEKSSKNFKSDSDFEKKLEKCEKVGIFCHDDKIFTLLDLGDKKESFEIPQENFPFDKFWQKLNSGELKLKVFDFKELLHVGNCDLEKHPKIRHADFFDIKIAAWILRPGERDYSLEKIFFSHTKEKLESIHDTTAHLFRLSDILEEKISQINLQDVLQKIEQPLSIVLYQMEKRGIALDKSILADLNKKIDKEIEKSEKEIYKLAGTEFNISSPKQLSEILFKKLKIETQDLRKTPGGVLSTQASELEKLKDKHKIIDWILQYREMTKLKTTYVVPLPLLVDTSSRIHTNFNQEGTATGRLSSDNPNLQNIPTRSSWGTAVRRAFVAQKGYKLVSFDYSQIELRVAASLAHDKKMLQIFKEGKDIHAMTAAEIEGVSEKEVTSALRREAKILNFGVLYGMSAQGFSEAAGVSRERAGEFIKQYFKTFEGVAQLVENLKNQVKAKGYVETLTGRRRYLPEIYASNWHIRQAAERAAINMPLQGLAADILKMAMIKIYDDILEKQSPEDIRMILQVHDELVFEIKEDKVKDFVSSIKNIMEQSYKLEAPVVVDAKEGDNWGELEEIHPVK
ncbi:MAG: DNA polymerase I [Patescibacteria group bacterium]